MHMQMIHRLPTIRANIDDRPITIAQPKLRRKFGCHYM